MPKYGASRSSPGLPAGTLFQPLFLYEMIWNVIGVIVIVFLQRKFTLQWGKVLAVYLIWYGLGRSYLESIRIDPSEFTFLGIPSNVWAAFGAVVLGVIIFLVQSRRHPGLEPSPYRPGREWVRPDAEVDSDDTDLEDEDTADADGVPNRWTIHTGTQVSAGAKYIITKWYRTRKWN